MKHIKLFESFDRYEFGEIDDDNLGYLVSSIEREYVNMNVQDTKIFLKHIPNGTNYDYGYCGTNRMHFYFTIKNKFWSISKVVYRVYNMGDYCYAMIGYNRDKYNNEVITKGWLIDDVDGVVSIINDIINKNEEMIKLFFK